MKYSVFIASLLATTVYAIPMNTTTTTQATSAVPSLAGNPNASPNPAIDAGFVRSLRIADSTVDRFTQIRDQIDVGKASIKFDFNPAANPGVHPGAGGAVYLANRVNYPPVTDLDISGAAFFFAPCGLNTPHTHPRGTEFFTVATNSNILTGFVLENGFVAEQNTTLTQYQGMVFPQGSIHWQQNIDCAPAVAIAALSSDDPGVSSIAQNFVINTSGDIVEAALGYPEQITPDNFAQFKASIPKPFVAGVQECYKRCGINH